MPARPVVLVTGAAKRLGRAIALDLAAQGFDLALHYLASAAAAQATVMELRGAGASATAFPADLADEAACRTLVPAVLAHFGRLDAVVNNASTFDYDDAQTATAAAMERHWRANTAPAVLLAQALHAHLLARRATGCVVNLLDQKLWNPNPDYFSYTLSKAALQAATVMLAQALAPVLRVCGVAPGLLLGSDYIDADRLAALQARTPLGVGVTPGQVAQAVRFLLQAPTATGTVIVVDAGSHLVRAPRDFAFTGAAHD
jgi:NAD(P)-dependent dehydrogenase (short-subunit alcohol dehydrogenase family)